MTKRGKDTGVMRLQRKGERGHGGERKTLKSFKERDNWKEEGGSRVLRCSESADGNGMREGKEITLNCVWSN